MMTSREQFEAWVSGQYPCEPMEDILLKVGPEKERYHLKLIQRLWEAWQASREAVEVDFPDKQFISEEDDLIPDEVDWPDGFNTALEQCAEAIRAAGVKVKGD